PLDHCGLTATEIGIPVSSNITCAESSPVTTTTGAQPASIAALTMRLTNVSPSKAASCFGFPKRVEPPAARTTAATLIRVPRQLLRLQKLRLYECHGRVHAGNHHIVPKGPPRLRTKSPTRFLPALRCQYRVQLARIGFSSQRLSRAVDIR